VGDLLERNKLLIGEISANHAARTPEALYRNALLIRELNGNVQRVMALYARLEAELAAAPDAPGALAGGGGGGGGGGDAPPALPAPAAAAGAPPPAEAN